MRLCLGEIGAGACAATTKTRMRPFPQGEPCSSVLLTHAAAKPGSKGMNVPPVTKVIALISPKHSFARQQPSSRGSRRSYRLPPTSLVLGAGLRLGPNFSGV